jgi:hypothetical protein
VLTFKVPYPNVITLKIEHNSENVCVNNKWQLGIAFGTLMNMSKTWQNKLNFSSDCFQNNYNSDIQTT